MLGLLPRVVDIHFTDEESNTHLPLFSIRHESLDEAAEELAGEIGALFTLLRKLRPGWMIRRQIIAVLGWDPAENEMAEVGTVKKGRFTVDPAKILSRTSIPCDPDKLYELPDHSAFTVVSCRDPTSLRRIGGGWKVTVGHNPRLYWVRDRDLLAESRRLQPALLNLMARHGTVHVPMPWSLEELTRLLRRAMK